MIYFFFIALIVLLIWIFKKPNALSISERGKTFQLNQNEAIIYEWEAYVPPDKDQKEDMGSGFLRGGKLLNLILTDQQRLMLVDKQQECFIFDSHSSGLFKEISKKSALPLFARVASARVIQVELPEASFELHVPNEAVPILMEWAKKSHD